jgi:hypothetical protein
MNHWFYASVEVDQRGPIFFFTRAKNSFPIGPKEQRKPSGTIVFKLIAYFRYPQQ